MFKCFVFPWKKEIFEIEIATFLSTNTSMHPFCYKFKSNNTFLSHKVWFFIVVAAINLASSVDYATISCFLEHQEKTSKPEIKQ